MDFLIRDTSVIQNIYNKSKVKRYIQLIIGGLLSAIAFNLFLLPNNLVPGGLSGLSIIIHEEFKMDPVLFISIASIFLLILSYIFLGKEKTKSTLLGVILLPIFIKLTANIGTIIKIDHTHILIASVFAGAVQGFAAGMILKAGFTGGGTDILIQILSKYAKMSMGKSLIFVDGMIILISSLVFGINKVMYAIVILYITSYMIDRAILGISDSKAFYIITKKEKEIKEFILKYLNHGVTVFKARGGFNKVKGNVLMCVLPTKDYYKLKEGIHQIDVDAFFVVTDSYEVFGGE